MFGVVSTYDPEVYTTKLDESKAAYADRLLQAFGIRSRGGQKQNEHTQGIPDFVMAANSGVKSASTTPKKRRSKKKDLTTAPPPTSIEGEEPPTSSNALVDLQSALAAFDDE